MMQGGLSTQAAEVSASASSTVAFDIDYLISMFMNLGLPAKLLDYITSAVSRINDIISMSGVQIVLFIAALQSIPGSLYEVAKIEGAEVIFNVVFIMTILSLVVQGTTVSSMAELFGLAYTEKESKFESALQDKVKSAFTEIAVTEQMLSEGNTLNKVALPDNTLVVMVCRDGDYFVPKGNASLQIGDKLLILSDRNDELADQYKEYGVEDIISFK